MVYVHGVCAPYLTEQLGGLSGVLRLQGFRHQRVQTGVHFLLSCFFILRLQTSQNTFVIKYQLWSVCLKGFCSKIHFTLVVSSIKVALLPSRTHISQLSRILNIQNESIIHAVWVRTENTLLLWCHFFPSHCCCGKEMNLNRPTSQRRVWETSFLLVSDLNKHVGQGEEMLPGVPVPRSAVQTAVWPAVSLWSLGADGTNCSDSSASHLLYTSPEMRQCNITIHSFVLQPCTPLRLLLNGFKRKLNDETSYSDIFMFRAVDFRTGL